MGSDAKMPSVVQPFGLLQCASSRTMFPLTTANYEESPLKVGGEDFSVLEVASAILRRRRTVVGWTFVASLFALYMAITTLSRDN